MIRPSTYGFAPHTLEYYPLQFEVEWSKTERLFLYKLVNEEFFEKFSSNIVDVRSYRLLYSLNRRRDDDRLLYSLWSHRESVWMPLETANEMEPEMDLTMEREDV